MLTETGQVVNLEGNFALIDVQRKSGCQSCSIKSGCGTSVLSKLFEKRFAHVRALNNVQAAEGDTVEIELNESSLVFMTFWVYLFPVLFMLTVMVVTSWLSGNNGFVVGYTIIGLVAGIYLSKRFIRSRLDARHLHPVISKVVETKI
jgi:sigma-E factor negative regulatory protein RseC